MLEISDLHAAIDGKPILKGISLTVNAGEVHAVMGPNGSGKSTLAQVLAGHPAYEITGGEVLYEGENLLEMAPEVRAQQGVFLAFQYPVEIPGVTNAYFLRAAYNEIRKAKGLDEVDPMEFLDLVEEKLKLVEMDASMLQRSVNAGFSGGEKKRNEILQMAVLEPKLAILDETDSGLDIDALRIVAERRQRAQAPGQRDHRRHALPAPAQLHRARTSCTCWPAAASCKLGRQVAGARARGARATTGCWRRRREPGCFPRPVLCRPGARPRRRRTRRRRSSALRREGAEAFARLGLPDHAQRRLALHQRVPDRGGAVHRRPPTARPARWWTQP